MALAHRVFECEAVGFAALALGGEALTARGEVQVAGAAFALQPVHPLAHVPHEVGRGAQLHEALHLAAPGRHQEGQRGVHALVLAIAVHGVIGAMRTSGDPRALLRCIKTGDLRSGCANVGAAAV
ncbi:MAG: hypothetical protein AB7P21_19155 [Lautropia sp.]